MFLIYMWVKKYVYLKCSKCYLKCPTKQALKSFGFFVIINIAWQIESRHFSILLFFYCNKKWFFCAKLWYKYINRVNTNKKMQKKKKLTHMKIVIFIIILYTKLLLLTNIYLRDYLLKNLLTLKLQWVYKNCLI